MIRFTLAFSIAALLAIASFTPGCKHPNCPGHRPEITVGLDNLVGRNTARTTSSAETFTNPIIASDWPDPTIIDGEDGYFYSVATQLKTIRRSTNLIDWQDTGIDPLAPSARFTLTNLTYNVWAPSFARLDNKWIIYISLHIVNSVDNRIFALTADKPTGPYHYASEVINGKNLGILDAIDPYVFKNDGKVWMFFGSCQGGIHRVELTGDGLSVKPGCIPVRVAGRFRKIDEPCIWGKPGTWEGSYLLNRHGWWYLFVSGGKYNDHTYYLTVGRSRTIDGDFHDREGNSMLKGLAKPILSSKKGEDIYGPGHNGEVFKSKDGKDWIFFHAHERSFKQNERPTFLQELKWDREFWPYFDGGKAKYVERRFEVAK